MLRRFSKKRKDTSEEGTSSSSALSSDELKRNKKLLSKFLEFITSSIWSIPIASFIESQSVVFDRQQMETLIYYEIHKEYAALIDTLIECFCEDVGSTSTQLVGAIRLFDQKDISEKYKVALEPLLAAQNFNVFVPMMMRKNIELQLQALQMIEFMCGLIPSVLQLEDGETLRHMKKLSPEETERYVLISVLRHSKDEYDSMQKGHSELEEVARNSRIQRELLEQNIRDEELLLMKASIEYVQKVAEMRKNNPAATQTDEPMSVVAAMASHFTVDAGVGPEDVNVLMTEKPQSSSNAIKTTASPETRPKSSLKNASTSRRNSKSDAGTSTAVETSDAATEPSRDTDKKRPGTAKGPNHRKFSKAGLEDLVGTEASQTQIEKPQINQATLTDQKSETDEPKSNTLIDATQIAEDMLITKEPKSRETSRPASKKSIRGASVARDEASGTSRPSSRKGTPHEPRAKTPASRTDERPPIRRSSVDKLAPKRNDSVPRERRSSLSKGKESDDKKPPKPVGPLRSNKLDGEVLLGRAESPGMEHGPRRKNLNDVNSHLVDPNRLNSSDVRNRAQYLREQRDKLLQMKNEERIKQMNDIQRSTVERPRTAQAARGILDKKETEKIRKEISDKLKTEILTLHN